MRHERIYNGWANWGGGHTGRWTPVNNLPILLSIAYSPDSLSLSMTISNFSDPVFWNWAAMFFFFFFSFLYWSHFSEKQVPGLTVKGRSLERERSPGLGARAAGGRRRGGLGRVPKPPSPLKFISAPPLGLSPGSLPVAEAAPAPPHAPLSSGFFFFF